MTHLESYVPLRNMRDKRNKTSQQTSYWPLKSEAEVSGEGISKDGNGTESTEMWSVIQNVKDYVLSSGYQIIDRITALCKTPRSRNEVSSRAPQWSNNPTKSQVRRFSAVWPNSLVDPEERSNWMKNMLSDPDVSGETKLIIWQMVENEYKVQAGYVPPKFLGNQQRLLPLKPMPHTSRYNPYGSRRISPRRSLYEASISNSVSPVHAARGLSSTFTERTAMTPYRREISPYQSQAWKKSRVSTSRRFDNFLGSRSSFSVPDTETQLRLRPTREFGLSPTANNNRSVNYSDPAISQTLEKYRRGGITYTKEDFDDYINVPKSQFVASRSRLQLSKINKSKQQKRKTYKNRCELSEISNVKRSRCEDRKEIGAGVSMDICSMSTGFEHDAWSTATILTQSPITKDECKHMNKSSKDDNLYNSESQMSTDSVASSSLFAAPTSGVVANLFGTMPKEAIDSSGAGKGGRFETSKHNILKRKNQSINTSLDKALAKAVATQSSDPKLSKVKLMSGISIPDLIDASQNSKLSMNLFVNQSPSKAKEKIIETKPIEKPSEKAPESKLKVSNKVAPTKIASVENVSYVCRMAQMRRIKIKEHYSQEIEKLYDRYCKDEDKEAKKKKALDKYEDKYHKTRQDYMFYSKLCKKYNVEPGEEYDGNDPDIKPDDEEKKEKSEATQSFWQTPTPLLFGIPSRTNIKSADAIKPFKSKLFTEKKTGKNGGYNFDWYNGDLLNQKPSKSKGLFFIPNSQGKETQKKDEKTKSSRNLITILENDAPTGNVFGGESNDALTIPKPSNTLFSSSAKPSDGGLFGTIVAKSNGGSLNSNSGGLFSGTNMFNVKSDNSTKPFVNCGSGSASSQDIFASNTTSQAPGSLLSPPSQTSSNTLFSTPEKRMFSTNKSGFNINNKNETTEPKFSFGNVSGKSKSSGKRRRIVRGRRTMK